jgi:hypothetical protein
VGQSGTPNAIVSVGAVHTILQVTAPDGSKISKNLRLAPDLMEGLFSDIACRKSQLYTWKNIAVGRDSGNCLSSIAGRKVIFLVEGVPFFLF